MRKQIPHGVRHRPAEAGFSLVEVLVALAITTVAALALAGMLAQGTALMLGSEAQLLAKQKATEAVESVFTARDTRLLTWAQIRNEIGETGADGGVFVDGLRPLRTPGPDGLVNTADDGAVEQLVRPGLDNILGTADDEHVPLNDFQREIEIRTLGPTLRRITVTIRFREGNGTRDYVLMTYISSYA
jgi:prepilin-type N-terminal cleavage/methylation domain-containing protein